jgi:hypothetical protein
MPRVADGGIERLSGRVGRVDGDFRDVGTGKGTAVVLQCPGGAAVGRDEDSDAIIADVARLAGTGVNDFIASGAARFGDSPP